MGMFDSIIFSDNFQKCPHCGEKSVSTDAQIKCFNDGGALDWFSFPDVVSKDQCSDLNKRFIGQADCSHCRNLVNVHFRMRNGIIYYAEIKSKEKKGKPVFKRFTTPSPELKNSIEEAKKLREKISKHLQIFEAISYSISNRDILMETAAEVIDSEIGEKFYIRYKNKNLPPETLFFSIKDMYKKLFNIK
jgi:hypothetical protein